MSQRHKTRDHSAKQPSSLASRVALWVVLAVVLTAGLWGVFRKARSGSEPGKTPGVNGPNVVLISIDMLRPDHLGCYGYSRTTSPRIDRLAREGAVFDCAVSSAPWTLPAHAAMFTGLADTVHRCLDTDQPLAAGRTTLAERMKGAGYATVGFFSGPYLHPAFGLGQGFDDYVDCTSYPMLSRKSMQDNGTVDGVPIWKASHSDVTSPHVYAEVQNWLRTKRHGPFFMFIHMWDPHFDFLPPPPYDTMFDPDYEGTATGRNFIFDPAINAQMPRRDLEHLIALYDGEIAWTDMHVGKILDELDELGLRDSTLVVLLSDHGTEFFEHGEKGHRQTLYDESIRIPLIVRYPGHVEANHRYARQARMIDVLPTITDLVGLPTPPDVMGQSLAPIFSGGAPVRDSLAISELFTRDPRHPEGFKMRSFRRAEYKLIEDLNKGRTMVFDLQADPHERMPLENPEAPLVRAATREAENGLKWLDAYRAALPAQATAAEIPRHVLEALKTFGYVHDDEKDAEDETPDSRPASQPTSEPASRKSWPPKAAAMPPDETPESQPASQPTTEPASRPASQPASREAEVSGSRGTAS